MNEGNSKYKLECYDSMFNLPTKYDVVFSQYSENEIFLSRSWFELFEQNVVSQNDQVCIFGLVCSNKPDVAVLVVPLWKKSSFGGMVKTLNSLGNYYTGNYEPLYAKNMVSFHEVFSSFLKKMALRSDWHAIDLRSLLTETVEFNALDTALCESSFLYQKYFMSGNWFLPTGNIDYKNLADNRPGVLRSTIKRKGGKFDKKQGTSIEIFLGDQIDEARVNDYWHVYDNSWKSEESHKQLINSLLKDSKSHTGVLGLAYLDGQPMAAQLWIVSGSKLFIYKLAHLEEFHSMSIGTVLLDRAMCHLYEKYSINEVDFLTGDDAYKKQWMTCRRELWGILLFNNKTLIGRMSAWLNIYGQKIKRMARVSARIDDE